MAPQLSRHRVSVMLNPYQLRWIDAELHAHAVSQVLAEIGNTRARVVLQFGRNDNTSTIQDSHNLQGAARIAPVKSAKAVTINDNALVSRSVQHDARSFHQLRNCL